MESQTELKSAAKTENNPIKKQIYNSLVKANPVLAGGMVVAPIVVFANTFRNAVTLTITFSVITFFTLLFSSFVPQRIVYTIRIILYTLIGSLVYVPAVIVLNSFMPEQINSMGVYFPMLITNSLIVSRSETTFFMENKSRMLIDIIFSIIVYDIVVLLFGFIREIISTGEFNGHIVAMPAVFSGFSYVYGGFILLSIFAALFRAVLLLIRKFKT